MTDSNLSGRAESPEKWPSLPLDEWQETYATLHMWTQVIGKIRLEQTPLINHWWNVPLYVSARGLTTSLMPYGERFFEIEFDFRDQQLRIECHDGASRSLPLTPRSVADFYSEVMAALSALGLKIEIYATPVEVPDPIPFPQDDTHATYDPEYAHRFWLALARSAKVFEEFRARFIGKVSPVHFFWGSFDLAVTRFNGREAPEREGADLITREAYSHEVISHGFWPGSGNVKEAAYYAYAAPEPEGFKTARVLPEAAFYNPETGGFILPYDAVRESPAPEAMLMDFLQSTYDAAADLARWDRPALERQK